MSEISMYEAQKKKMQGLCDEHDLVYRFEKDRYPIIFTIKPVQGMDAQISMLENVEEVGYRSPDASMSWIFEDGGLDTKVTGGTFYERKENRFCAACRTARKKQAQRHWCRVNGMSRK